MRLCVADLMTRARGGVARAAPATWLSGGSPTFLFAPRVMARASCAWRSRRARRSFRRAAIRADGGPPQQQRLSITLASAEHHRRRHTATCVTTQRFEDAAAPAPFVRVEVAAGRRADAPGPHQHGVLDRVDRNGNNARANAHVHAARHDVLRGGGGRRAARRWLLLSPLGVAPVLEAYAPRVGGPAGRRSGACSRRRLSSAASSGERYWRLS